MSTRKNAGSAAGGRGTKPSKPQLRQKQAAQRAMAAASGARVARNKRLLQVVVPVVAVLAVAGVLIGVYAGQNHSKKANTTTSAGTVLTTTVTSVPASVYNQVGPGRAAGPPTR